MAIKWEFKITVLDIERKEVSVAATRTDDTDPDNIQIQTCHVLSALVDTPARKAAVLDGLWHQHILQDQRAAKISEIVGGLEIQAKTNLEARE